MPNDDYIGVPAGYRPVRGQAPATPARPSPEYRLNPRDRALQPPTPARGPQVIYGGVPIYRESSIYGLYNLPRFGQGSLAEKQVQLYRMGYLKNSSSWSLGQMSSTVESAFRAAYEKANKMGMSIDEMERQDQIAAAQAAMLGMTQNTTTTSGGGGGGGGGGGSTTTYTSSSVSQASRTQAQAILTNALRDQLGREPMAGEIDAFMRSLNSAAAKNPTVTTQTTSTSGDSVNSTTKTKEGLAANQYAKNCGKTMVPNEYKKFQDSQYMDVLKQMLGM